MPQSYSKTWRIARTPGGGGPLQVGEQTLWQDNPSQWVYLGHYVLIGIPLLVGCYILSDILPPVLIGMPLLIWAILDRKYTVYTVTDRRVIQKRGIIGRHLSEVDLVDIRNVVVKYGVLGRILGFGSVLLGTAAHAGMEIQMSGCRNPEVVRQLITDTKDRARKLTQQP